MSGTTPRRILLATFGSLGDLQPFLAIGTELRARGHQPIVATSETYRDRVAAANLEFSPVRPDRIPGQRDPDFFDRLWRERAAPATIFRDMFLPALRESVEDTLRAVAAVDAIVSHPLAPAARLVAETQGLPWISTVMQPMGYLSAYEPPQVGPAWIAAALRALGPRPTGQVMRFARKLTGGWASEWRQIRHELGLPPTQYHPLWEGQHSPRLSLGLFPSVLGASQPDWPPQARVTGFPFYRPPGRSLDPALRQFLLDGDPPLVFTLGTTAVNEPGAFFAESLAAARDLGLRSVLLAGPRARATLPEAASDAIAVEYAPHDLLFPHALAVVHQGGIGTLAEAMQAGKPMLIMPYAHDQTDNAWRAARLGVARVISRRHYQSDALRLEMSRVLKDPTAFDAAAAAAIAIARESGAKIAAELILDALT